MQVSLIVLIVVAVICTQLWSVVSWFVQFRRMFAVCFFISLIWNWFHLYMVRIFALLTVRNISEPMKFLNTMNFFLIKFFF